MCAKLQTSLVEVISWLVYMIVNGEDVWVAKAIID